MRPATMVAMGAPRNARPSKGVLRDLLADSAARNVQACSVEKSVRSAGSPAAMRARASQDARRPGGEQLDHAHRATASRRAPVPAPSAKRRLESGDAKGRAIEFDFLARRFVRRMVGGDGVHGAVGEPFDQRRAIFGGGQRRIHLEVRVVDHVFVAQA